MTTMTTSMKSEIGRKRVAKLFGVAPYRVEFVLSEQGVFQIEVDGKKASPEQIAVFNKDIDNMLSVMKTQMN